MQFPNYRAFIAGLAVLVATAVPGWSDAPEGYTALFNGRDLSGWSGDEALWSVDNGEIVGSTHGTKLKHNTFLSTKESFGDFRLLAKVKLINHNSGIQFRSEQYPDHVVKGYQADVAEKTYFGMLYEEGGRGIMPYWNEKSDAERERIQTEVAKQGEWNEYEIVCEGDHVQMILNGTTTCDIIDPEGAKRGIIALQLHSGPEMEVRFKDLFIQQLGDGGEEPLLMPEIDKTRSERVSALEGRFQTPEGFTVEQVATDEEIHSTIGITFDYKGRPVVASEKEGIFILEDEDGDGKFEKQIRYTGAVSTTMGMCFVEDGKLLVQAAGITGPALYELTDTDMNDEVDMVRLVQKSDGPMGEHGPHAIRIGADGDLYVLYGNHAHPARPVDPSSPLADPQEDFLLPRYVDPRGHANSVMVPGGTIQRVDPDNMKTSWQQVLGGFRNPYDFDINAQGEMMTFDSDMEWDLGLPWFRPVRVVHAIPGGDYGWRTGSSKIPTYQIDTLPSLDDIGRGSPVGVAFYEHHVYPARFRGAYLMGDWSRGRLRIVFPKTAGATYTGKTMDFVLGEPLNITDLDVGPDGFVYFTVGGRGTVGGMYRIRYTGESDQPAPSTDGILRVLDQDMPRSAWGRHAILAVKAEMGEEAWNKALRDSATDASLSDARRLHALEALSVHGPKPDAAFLAKLLKDENAAVRAMAVLLLGADKDLNDLQAFVAPLSDENPLVVRRAAEALVRQGLSPETPADVATPIAKILKEQLDNGDRFARYSVRNALRRAPVATWRDAVLAMSPADNAIGFMEGTLAAIYAATTPEDSDAIFGAIQGVDVAALSDEALLDYLRVVSLAYIRDKRTEADRSALADAAGPILLAKFPNANHALNRELQTLLAHFETPGTIGALLAYLSTDLTQEDQIYTVYCLRTIESGWDRAQRDQLVAWFDVGREIGGGASMEGYINNLWDATLALLPEDEQQLAEARKTKALEERREAALALMADLEESRDKNASMELAQMSFEELANYLEYDPMAYKPGGLARGKNVFLRSKCADCHVFADIGKGGGPDLSTVASRFRRRDLLEAIMYPSKIVSDQYETVHVQLDDFTEVTGMVAGETENTLTLITITGDRVEIDKSTIEKREKSDQSGMPEGLLNTMSQDELVDLIKYLESGGATE